MASIINSTTTSPGGLISTGDSANSLLIQTGDTTAITINSSQQVALTNPLGAASGGTGLSSPGTAGNVLQSNGSAWVSTAFSAGFSGATTTTSAVNITLTSSSDQVQRVIMTATDKNVILPDATTCTEGGVIFNIVNAGTIPFNVIDGTGYSYGTLTPTQAASYFLGNNSTSAGKWSTAVAENQFTTLNAAPLANGQARVIALTDTSGVVIRASTPYIYATAYTISGSTFTWGTETTIYTNPSSTGNTLSELIKLTDTTFLVTFSRNYATSRSDGMAIACSVSGTTITPGTAVTIQSSAGNSQSVNFHFTLRFSSTVLLAIYEYYSSGNYGNYYNPLSISGTTITVGSQGTWTIVGANNYVLPMFACKVSSTTALLGWHKPNLGTYGPVVVVMSGATVSSFTETTTNDFGSIYGYSWSPSTDVAYVYSTQSTSAYKWTVSGTSVTQNNAGTISANTLGGVIPAIGYNNQLVMQYTYRLGTAASYSTLYTAAGSSDPVNYFAYGGNSGGVRPTCNVVPTSGGIVAVLLSDGLTVSLIKGFV